MSGSRSRNAPRHRHFHALDIPVQCYRSPRHGYGGEQRRSKRMEVHVPRYQSSSDPDLDCCMPLSRSWSMIDLPSGRARRMPMRMQAGADNYCNDDNTDEQAEQYYHSIDPGVNRGDMNCDYQSYQNPYDMQTPMNLPTSTPYRRQNLPACQPQQSGSSYYDASYRHMPERRPPPMRQQPQQRLNRSPSNAPSVHNGGGRQPQYSMTDCTIPGLQGRSLGPLMTPPRETFMSIPSSRFGQMSSGMGHGGCSQGQGMRQDGLNGGASGMAFGAANAQDSFMNAQSSRGMNSFQASGNSRDCPPSIEMQYGRDSCARQSIRVEPCDPKPPEDKCTRGREPLPCQGCALFEEEETFVRTNCAFLNPKIAEKMQGNLPKFCMPRDKEDFICSKRRELWDNLVKDQYCPGAIQDTVDKATDFNVLSYDIVFGQSRIPDDLPCGVDPISLLEAFFMRVNFESCQIKKWEEQIKEGDSPAAEEKQPDVMLLIEKCFRHKYQTELNVAIENYLKAERMFEEQHPEPEMAIMDLTLEKCSTDVPGVPIKIRAYSGTTKPKQK